MHVGTMVPIVKMSRERASKESYLSKVKELAQGQVGMQGLVFPIKDIFSPSHNTLSFAASKAPPLVQGCLAEA